MTWHDHVLLDWRFPRPQEVQVMAVTGSLFRATARGRRSLTWYVRYRCPSSGRRVTVSTKCRDRANAQRWLQSFLRDLELGTLPGEGDTAKLKEASKRTIAEHLDDFEEELTARRCSDQHVVATVRRARAALARCRTVRDITENKVITAIAAERTSRKFGGQTETYYRQSVRAFTAWLKRNRRLEADPLENLPTKVKGEPLRLRRALTPAEFNLLLQTAPWEHSILYLVAAYSGYRRKELRSLTVNDLSLDADPPVIRCHATKNGKVACQPIRRDVADALKLWIEDQQLQSGDRLLHVVKHTGQQMKADLERAGIPYRTDEGVADLHSLRSWYVSQLALANVPVVTAQRLARHCVPSLTMNVYAKVKQSDKASAVEAMPAVAPFRRQA